MNESEVEASSWPDEPQTLFGMPRLMDYGTALEVVGALDSLWRAQLAKLSRGEQEGAEIRSANWARRALREDLVLLKRWFDPVASGARLRSELQGLSPTRVAFDVVPALFIFRVDEHHALVTPEGRAALWVLRRQLELDPPGANAVGEVLLSDEECQAAVAEVHALYRGWVLHRLSDVSALLQGKSASLRPAALGLLLVLLINRNTARERRLPAPEDPGFSNEISQALARPALAFAAELSGTKGGSERSLDLYRGWALGELSRRLGSSLHRSAGGVWIDEGAVDEAVELLAQSLADRSPQVSSRVPVAIERAWREYNLNRPLLNSLGLAHERPSSTRRLFDRLLAGRPDVLCGHV